MLNPYESPQLEPASQELVEPLSADDGRLGPQHGLFYLFGVAIATALNSSVREAIQYFDFPLWWWPLLVTVALDGVGIAAILWLGWQRWSRSYAFPRTFGHWLLLIQGASCVVDAVYLIIYDRLIPRLPGIEAVAASPEVEFQVRALYAVMRTAAAVVPWLALRYSRKQTLWVRYGVVVLISPLLTALWYFLGWEQSELARTMSTAIGFIGLLCLLVAAVRDFNHPQELDQLHWVGVVCQLALVLWVRFTDSYWASFAQY